MISEGLCVYSSAFPSRAGLADQGSRGGGICVIRSVFLDPKALIPQPEVRVTVPGWEEAQRPQGDCLSPTSLELLCWDKTRAFMALPACLLLQPPCVHTKIRIFPGSCCLVSQKLGTWQSDHALGHRCLWKPNHNSHHLVRFKFLLILKHWSWANPRNDS